jgi:glycyl-tRNA synthetase alpha chain
MLRRQLDDWEREAARCLDHEPPLVLPALEATLKTSHLFNLLDARGAVSVTERVGLIARVRRNAVRVARAFVAQRESFGHPLGNALAAAETV